MGQALFDTSSASTSPKKENTSLCSRLFQTVSISKCVGEYDTKIYVKTGAGNSCLDNLNGAKSIITYFGDAVFNSRLGRLVVAYNRNARYAGYFLDTAWVDEEQRSIPEIGINPEIFELSDEYSVSIVVRACCHLLQNKYGTPGRDGYNNKQFADLMEYVGLQCSSNGLPGGKRTGDRVGHYVIPGGRYQKLFNAMPADYLSGLKAYKHIKNQKRYDRITSKTAYACPTCSLKMWGAPNQPVGCTRCNQSLISFHS